MAELGQLRDEWEHFQSAGVAIAALSSDPPETNARVREKERLPFPILYDKDLALCREIGLLHEDGHAGEDIARPAAILVNERIHVVWTYQGSTIQDRATPAIVLEAIHSTLQLGEQS